MPWSQWPVKLYVQNICEEDIQSEGIPWYKWSIAIDRTEPETFLDAIEEVVYHLHPTFDPPVYSVARDQQNANFRLHGAGWGEFTVQINIKLDGKISKGNKHDLLLSPKGNMTTIKLKQEDFL